ncbi:hypothetical protein [Nonomuraea sp. B19D2]
MADQLAGVTIDNRLARSDLEIGIDALPSGKLSIACAVIALS